MSDPDDDYAPSDLPPESSPPGNRRVPSAEIDGLAIDDTQKKSVELPIRNAIIDGARNKVKLHKHCFSETLDRYGYMGIIDTAYRVSRDALHPFHVGYDFKSLAAWRVIGTDLLGDIPLPLLRALLNGTLDAKVKSNDLNDPVAKEMKEYFIDESNYWRMRQQGGFAPIHYVRMFTDGAGNPPSHKQLCLVLEGLKQYVSGDPQHDRFCAEVDNTTRAGRIDAAGIRKGLHHYLEGSAGRANLLHTFIAAHETYLATIAPADRDKPIPDPLQYVGFTTNIIRRTIDHEYGESSWLMTLFEVVCTRLFHNADKTSVFTFETFVVAFPVNRDECRLGEELLCRLCRSYCYNGLGFNIQQGGMSNVAPKLEDYSERTARNMWDERVVFRNESPVFKDQVVEDIKVYQGEWERYLGYLKRGHDQYQQDLLDKADEKVTDLKRGHVETDDVHDVIRAVEEVNRRKEAAVDLEIVREALVARQRREVEKLKEGLEAVRDTPAPGI
jgi:hypothetical protein